jgi:hypothetical protein
MDELVNRVFSLPPELIVNCAWDAKTLVRLQLAAIARRDEPRFLLLDQQWKRIGFKTREIFEVLDKFQENPVVDQLINRLLRPYTLQRQIRELFEGGLYVRGYALLKTLLSYGPIFEYIYDKYFPHIFRARLELKEWNIVRENLSTPGIIWRAFEVYRTLNFEQQQELRSQLDNQRNLLAEFLIDAEGTEVDDWTDELINDWLTASTLLDPIILKAPAFYRVVAVRNLLYYSHGDPRFNPEVKGFGIISDELSQAFVGGPFAMIERDFLHRMVMADQSANDILAVFRGDEKDFEQLFLQVVRDWTDLRLTVNEFTHLDEDAILRIYHDRHWHIELNDVVLLPFYQYPNLVEKYGSIINFRKPLSSSEFETIFDLIDYQDRLQALRYLVERGQNSHHWSEEGILKVFGVKL